MVKKGRKRQSYRLCVGVDISLSSIALCAKSFDPITGNIYGPVWNATRWNKRDHVQWDKLKLLSDAHEFIFQLQNKLGGGGVVRDIGQVHIGVEELPARVLNSNRYREQAELNGAFVGSLLKWGYEHVYSVNVKAWQSLVAADLDMKLGRDFTKFHVKEWVKEVYGKSWKDLISSPNGLITKPKTSKAKPAQPDDRVDATGIMEWVWEKVR
jgi:hypothetical protein